MKKHKRQLKKKINDNEQLAIIEPKITEDEISESKPIKEININNQISDADFERINASDKRFRKPVIRVLSNPQKNKFLWGGGNGLKPSALYSRILKAFYQVQHIYLSRTEAIKIYKLDKFKKRKMRSYYLRSWWTGIPRDFYNFVISAYEKVKESK